MLSVYEINKFIEENEGFSTDSTLGEVITQLQVGKDYTCAQCEGETKISDPFNDGEFIPCPLCLGDGKTVIEYEAETEVVRFVPVPVEEDEG